LFAVGDIPPRITRAQLLTATPSSEDFVTQSDNASLTLRPFSVIMDESYRLYHQVKG
jgi:hypothetical protein